MLNAHFFCAKWALSTRIFWCAFSKEMLKCVIICARSQTKWVALGRISVFSEKGQYPIHVSLELQSIELTPPCRMIRIFKICFSKEIMLLKQRVLRAEFKSISKTWKKKKKNNYREQDHNSNSLLKYMKWKMLEELYNLFSTECNGVASSWFY